MQPVTAPTTRSKTHLANPSKRGLAARFVRWLTTANNCPPRAVAGTALILRLVDHVVTPVQATMPDIVAAQRTVALAAAAGKPLSFVVNRAPARAVEVIQAREVLERAGPVSPVTIGDRRAFARSLTESLSVNEYARDDAKAVDEIFRYWLWLDLHHWEIEKSWQRRQAA